MSEEFIKKMIRIAETMHPNFNTLSHNDRVRIVNRYVNIYKSLDKEQK